MLNNKCKKIAILSGKGGVGKSTITRNLAENLHNRGNKVGILDADVDTPNMPQIAGLPTDHVLEIIDEIIIPYDWNGIDVVSLAFSFPPEAPVLWDDSQRQEVIEQIVRLTKWNDLDYLLIDCPAGTGGELFAVLKLTQVVGGIIVTTPHAAAVSDAKRAKKALFEYRTPLIGIINNMSYSPIACPKCDHNFDILYAKEPIWTKDELLGEIPLLPEIITTNQIKNFDPIVAQILTRIPQLKEVKYYPKKLINIQRKLAKVALKRFSKVKT